MDVWCYSCRFSPSFTFPLGRFETGSGYPASWWEGRFIAILLGGAAEVPNAEGGH